MWPSTAHAFVCIIVTMSIHVTVLSLQSYWYGASVYTATKYAQRGFAETLRMELVPFNIRVSVVCPGFTDTPFLDDGEHTTVLSVH